MRTYLSRRDLAARFGIPVKTLERWALNGEGPPFTRFGPRRVFYSAEAFEAWAAARTFPHRAAELAQQRRRSAA